MSIVTLTWNEKKKKKEKVNKYYQITTGFRVYLVFAAQFKN